MLPDYDRNHQHMLLIRQFRMWRECHSSEIRLFVVVLFALGIAAFYLSLHLMVPQKEDPDEGVYLMAARLLNAGHPCSSFSFDQFWMFPRLLAASFQIFHDSLGVGRVVVVVFSVTGLIGMAVLAGQLGAPWAAPLAIICGVIDPCYLAQSRIALSDVPGVACMIWAVVTITLFRRRDQRGWLALGGAITASALVIKPLTVIFAAVLVAWLILHRIQRSDAGLQLKLRELALDFMVFGGAAILIAAPFVDFGDLAGEFRRTVFAHWTESQQDAPGVIQRLRGLLNYIARVFMWLPFAVVGIWGGMRSDRQLTTGLAAGELLSAALLVQFPPWPNHYTLLSPVLIVFAAAGMHHALMLLKHSFDRAGQSRGGIGSTAGPKFITVLSRLGISVWLLSLPWLVHNNLQVLDEPTNDLTSLTTYLKANGASGRYLLTDNAIIVYRADGLIPPIAMNLPFPRTFSSYANGRNELQKVMSRYPVSAIVLTSDYAQDPRLIFWIRQQFPNSALVRGNSLETTAHVFSRAK